LKTCVAYYKLYIFRLSLGRACKSDTPVQWTGLTLLEVVHQCTVVSL